MLWNVVVKSYHHNLTKPDIEQQPDADQPGVITGFVVTGTQIGTQRNSLYATAYHIEHNLGMVAAEVSDNHRTDHQLMPRYPLPVSGQ